MRDKKTWIKALYWATKDNLEVAQSALLECKALGIEIDDGAVPDGGSRFDHEKILLQAYFEPEKDIALLIQTTLDNFFAECGFKPEKIEFVEVLEEDWQANFVKTCTTFIVKPAIYIVPSFERDEFLKTNSDKLYIEMDPENAFGTGQHQTTKLCLTNLYDLLKDHPCREGLDVGTGSGILAILMKKLGAEKVLATEVDQDALVTAQKNAIKNSVEIAFLPVDEHYRYQNNTYDVVVANILAPVLIDMADNLAFSLAKHGYLIVSGILDYQAQSVIDAYKKHELVLIKQDNMDDWCALIFQK